MTITSYKPPIFKSALSAEINFRDVASCVDGHHYVVAIFDKENNQTGDCLDDNARKQDGYRYHDVVHFAKDQILQYSPVMQKLKGIDIHSRDVKADEIGTLLMFNTFWGTKKDRQFGVQNSYNISYGHHRDKPEFQTYKAAMENAYDIFQKMIAIKKENPEPINITVGYNGDENKIEYRGFKPLTT